MNAKQRKAAEERLEALDKAKAEILQAARIRHRQQLAPWLKRGIVSALHDTEEMFVSQAMRCGFGVDQMPEVMALAYSDKLAMPPVLRYGLHVGLLGIEDVRLELQA